MKKNIIITIISFFSLFVFVGCCREHQWVEATCDAPKTCSVCEKIEGEKLEHIWKEATCSAPKTCTLCGKTEGETLPHTEGTKANYQSGAICSVCGTEMSEKLAPEFESLNVPGTFAELNQTLPYLTSCYEDPSQLTTGKATAIEYERFDSDEFHEAEEGYEWIKFTWQVTYNDENANNFGFMTGPCFEDYYTPKLHDDTTVALDEDDFFASFTTNYNGEDYPDCIREYGIWDWGDGWGDTSITGTNTSYVRIPKGYDGMVFGLRNRQKEWSEGQYIYDVADSDTIFFRCQ